MKQIRLALTLRPELDEVLTYIANYQKVPKTSVVSEILMECLPVLQGIADAYKQIEDKKNPTLIMNAMLGSMMQKVGEFGKEIEEHSRAQMKKCPDTLEMDLPKPE